MWNRRQECRLAKRRTQTAASDRYLTKLAQVLVALRETHGTFWKALKRGRGKRRTNVGGCWEWKWNGGEKRCEWKTVVWSKWSNEVSLQPNRVIAGINESAWMKIAIAFRSNNCNYCFPRQLAVTVSIVFLIDSRGSTPTHLRIGERKISLRSSAKLGTFFGRSATKLPTNVHG